LRLEPEDLVRVLTAALVLFALYFPVAIYSALSYSAPQDGDLRPLPVMSALQRMAPVYRHSGYQERQPKLRSTKTAL